MDVRANNGRTSGAVRAMFNDPVPDPEYYSPPSRISPRRKTPRPTRERTIPTPSNIFIRLLLIVTQVPAHESDDSNNNPTTRRTTRKEPRTCPSVTVCRQTP